MNRPLALQSIMTGVAGRRPFKVGRATVDPVSRDATWPDGQERLQPQTMKVLIALLSRRGEVVTRDELVQLCWDGRIVGDDVINRSILLLRHFAEHAGGFEIETVSRAGYRLIEREAAVGLTFKRRWMAAAGVLVVSLVGLTAWVRLDRPPANQGMPPAPSISVVPFVVEANDPLVRQVALTTPSSVARMLAESGFDDVHEDPAASPGNARSDYILSGTVRRMADSVEATVQMVSRPDGTVAFAHDFTAPLSRAADLPDRIGATASADLAWTGAQMVLDPREHLNPAVASELMSAMSQTVEDGNSLRAYQLARHAAEQAPDSAMAQLTFAVQSGFSIYSIPRAERAGAVALGLRASQRARALAPEFGDVYITDCRLHSPVRMAECDAVARRALQIDSRSSYVPGFLSNLLYDAGRFDDSLQFARQSMANDPYKPAKLARMSVVLAADGRQHAAEQVYEQAVRLWPGNVKVHFGRLRGLAEAGNYAAVERFADPKADAEALDLSVLRQLVAAARTHDRAHARRACAAQGLKPLTLPICMTVLADVGDLDGAYALARKFYPSWLAPRGADEDRIWMDHPEGYEVAFLTGPAGKAMRTDSRFVSLVQEQGLLEYWRKDGLPDFCRPPHPEQVCALLNARN